MVLGSFGVKRQQQGSQAYSPPKAQLEQLDAGRDVPKQQAPLILQL